jgi:cytochrome c2
MRVSTLDGRQDSFNARTRPGDLAWNTLFETSPCVALATKARPPKFDGLFNGGRLVLLNDHELLLSTGDHAMEGFGFDIAASQDPNGSYGKVILIDLLNGSSSIYSLGLRNPEGLHLAPDGTLWETEHGPRGGDELNRIVRGANYGWPLATYGVEYGTLGWPLSLVPGSHDGYEQPYYSWYPSIGPSNLIEVTSPLFRIWHGDLLVSSLAGQTLFRMRIRDNRVVHTEQIHIGERIRDILEGHRGEIVLWTDRESMIFLEPSADTASGEALYEACAACHVSVDGTTASVGPSLKGVYGRKVASLKGFEYSASLSGLGGEWTRDRLDAFLKDPAAFAPGTTMMFGGIADARSRTSLVDYMVAPTSRLDVAPPPTNKD